jgi:hypothetical protein
MADEGSWAKIQREVLTAPPGKFRVVLVDTFEPPGEGHVVLGDYDKLEDALARAREETPGNPRYVYDDKGRELSKSKGPTGGGAKDKAKSNGEERSNKVISLLDRRLREKDRAATKGAKGTVGKA